MATVDWTEPCARAAALRSAYYRLISGDAESLIHRTTPEGSEEVRFARADIEKLKLELDAAEAECAVANGSAVPARARRFAIRAGSYNPYPPYVNPRNR